MHALPNQWQNYNSAPFLYPYNTPPQQHPLSIQTPMTTCQTVRNEPYNPSTSQKDFQHFVNSLTLQKMNISEKLWNGIVHQIEELVELSQNTINAELEVHIGRLEKQDKKRFRSGVSLVWFEEQLKKMESFDKWDHYSKDWERIEEYIFDRDIRLRRNPDGMGTFMKKTLIKGIDIRMDDAKYDLRIVLKSENDSHINYGRPNYYRFKERKTFTHKNFTYFFTKIWEGKSLNQVCSRTPKYEIELECTKMSTNIAYITKSMLIKCKDLIGQAHYNAPLYQPPTNSYNRSNDYQPNETGKRPNTQSEYNSPHPLSEGPQKQSEGPQKQYNDVKRQRNESISYQPQALYT